MQTHAALQYQSAAIIYDSTDTYSTSVKDELTTALGTANVDILATEAFATTDTDFMTQLMNINSMAPDVVFVAALSTQMVQIIEQADALGVSSRLIVPDLTQVEVGRCRCCSWRMQSLLQDGQNLMPIQETKLLSKVIWTNTVIHPKSLGCPSVRKSEYTGKCD